MRATRTFFLVLVIALVCFSYVANDSYAFYSLPNSAYVDAYVENLIGSYNALFSPYLPAQPNFPLYHPIGDNFEVIVLQTNSNDSNFITLIFIPIEGNFSNIILNNTVTFCDLFYNTVGFNCPDGPGTFWGLPLEYASTIFSLYFALSIPSSQISSNYTVNSKNEATSLYDSEIAQSTLTLQQETASAPQVQTTTTSYPNSEPMPTASETSSSKSNSGISINIPVNFGIVPDTIIAILFVIGLVLYFIHRALVDYFGSAREYIRVLRDSRRRNLAIREVLNLFRIRKKSEKYDREVKQNQKMGKSH